MVHLSAQSAVASLQKLVLVILHAVKNRSEVTFSFEVAI